MTLFFVVNRTTNYPISEIDKNITARIVQYILIFYVFLYTLHFNTRIIYVILKNTKLRIPGNVILCFILITDIAIVTNFGITTVCFTLYENVQLSKLSAGTILLLELFLTGTQRWYLALASLEKMFYFIKVYQHTKVFGHRKTLVYLLLITVVSFIFSFITVISNNVVYRPDRLMCNVYYSFKNAAITEKITMIIRLTVEISVFIISSLFLLITFVFSFIIAKLDPTLGRKRLVWIRMMRNFLSLFSVSFVIFIGAIVTKFSADFDYPLLTRLGTLLYMLGSPALNPLIILYGNVPVRKAFFEKKDFITNYAQNVIGNSVSDC